MRKAPSTAPMASATAISANIAGKQVTLLQGSRLVCSSLLSACSTPTRSQVLTLEDSGVAGQGILAVPSVKQRQAFSRP